jgi:hypothetical protein
LSELIISSAEKYNQKAVILLDEYDKPYVDFLNDRAMADKVRNVLRDYYVRLKSKDEYIRFTFITGISKFAKMGVFSTLNTPNDISMTPRYAEICGYSEEEVIRYFPDYLEETADEMLIAVPELLDRMRYYYNGFTFDWDVSTRLYNPFSTLNFFDKKKFSNFRIHSGRSKMIADYMKNRNLTVEQFRNFPVSLDFVESPDDMDITPPEGFLYQNGYLTLRKGTINEFSLDCPNMEVLNSMSSLVTQNILSQPASGFQKELFAALRFKDVERFVEILNRLLASIPYDDFASAAKQNVYEKRYPYSAQEWLYRSSIYSFMQGCGLVVVAEMHTNKGQADLVINYQGAYFVIEIKVVDNAENAVIKAQEAYQQIIDGNYAKPYPNAVCIGLGIDDGVRQISGFVES